MSILRLQARAVTALALCGAVVAGCGNDEEDSGGSGGGEGTGASGITGTGGTVITGLGGATTGGAVGVTGGTTSTSVCEGLSVVGGTEPLIDDFEDTTSNVLPALDNRAGSWFIANDETPGDAPDVDQSPEDGLPTAAIGRNGTAGFRSMATGYKGWGALFGVSLNDKAKSPCAYDASAYDGISFWAKSGDGSTQQIRVAVPLPLIIPVERGGSCVGTDCDDSHLTVITVTDEWQLFEIEWDELNQTGATENVYDFDSAKISQITWGVQGAEEGTGKYDIIIDDLRFIGEGNPGGGGAGGAN